jgi:hypothetical protein
MKWAYLGHLGPDGQLDWGGSHSGNIPPSGQILPDNHDVGVDLKIRQLAREGLYEGRQVDWGAYAIKVNGPQLLEVLELCYGHLDHPNDQSIKARYVAFARQLGLEDFVAFLSVEM